MPHPEHYTSDADSPSLHYTLQGAGDDMVVLLHELGGSIKSWHGVAQRLASSFTVVSIDQRGHGLSEKTRVPYSRDDLASDLLAVLRDVNGHLNVQGKRVWLVGLAAGAAIAVSFAARVTKHHDIDVQGLVLCCPALEVDRTRRDYLEARAARAVSHGMRAIVDASLERSYPPVTRERLGAEAFHRYRARFLANDPVSYALANRALADANAPATSSLEALSGPVLMIAGIHDLLRPPAEIQALAAQTAHAAYAEIDAGHLASTHAPDALADAIEAFVTMHTREAAH